MTPRLMNVRVPVGSHNWTIKNGTPPPAPGVYVFYAGSRMLYVGSSRRLDTRIGSHTDLLGVPAVRVGWAETPDYRIVEQQWIATLQPAFNGRFQRRCHWLRWKA